MNKIEKLAQPLLASLLKHADNIKAVKSFEKDLQLSVDNYYLSICGDDRRKLSYRGWDIEKYVSDECILHSTHMFCDQSYTLYVDHLMMDNQKVAYYHLFNLGEKLCIALPRGIVEIQNPNKIAKEKILVCRITNYPNKEHNQAPYVVFDEIPPRYIPGGREDYPPKFNNNSAYFWIEGRRQTKKYSVIIQATESGGYTVYNRICNNFLVKEVKSTPLEESSAYEWAHVGLTCKSGSKFREGAWATPEVEP